MKQSTTLLFLYIDIYRAIDIQNLVGNVGGYIGLCLGYSMLQIPDLVLLIATSIKRSFGKIQKKQQNIPLNSLHITSRRKNQSKQNDLTLKDLKQNTSEEGLSLTIEVEKLIEKVYRLEKLSKMK